jgi:hypothetical protein
MEERIMPSRDQNCLHCAINEEGRVDPSEAVLRIAEAVRNLPLLKTPNWNDPGVATIWNPGNVG